MDSHIISSATTGCASGSIFAALMPGLPAAIVALIVAVIAWRQYEVAKAKLKLDLFDKRYAIFQKTWMILSEVIVDGIRKQNYGLATPFNNFLPEAAFLFGKDIDQYLNEATRKWTELRAVEDETDGQPTNLHGNFEKRRDLRDWFEEQASKGAKTKFGRYLNFEKWK